MADVSQIRLPNGDTFDLIDEKSGYITAQYIENKTDYSIPVSRVGEIVVGETAIGTDSTNFPTSKAVVDYVDERVVQEIDAIDVGVTGIKANGTSLSINDGVVNIPVIGPGQSVGLMTEGYMYQIWNSLDSIPTSTSQLTNDSGFITSETDPTVPDWAKASTKPTYTASEVGALPSNTFIPQVFKVNYNSSTNTANKTYTEIDQAYNRGDLVLLLYNEDIYQTTRASAGYVFTTITDFTSRDGQGNVIKTIKQLKLYTSNTWHSTSYQFPSKTSDLTNDSGYLTASDIASVMTYKGTKANYAALPASGNTTGDVWHLTGTGAEWAWDGSAWQELGTAIDLSNYLTTSDIAAWAKASTKPTYTAAEVGALPDSTVIPSKTSDLTNDSGFITSDSDENVKQIPLNGTNSFKGLLFSSGTGGSQVINTVYTTDKLQWNDYDSGPVLYIYNGSKTKHGSLSSSALWLTSLTTNYQGKLQLAATTDTRTYTLPDKTGTVALTSDIPSVYSSTNTGGYLTMATLPIYDGTVV